MSDRKPIPKKVRQQVYDMYNGHCAYCGCELEMKDMQVDHVMCVYVHEDYMEDGELNNLSNYKPSCRACNFYKGTWSLEAFRDNLTTMLYRNLAKNFNYKLLKKYGLIKEDIRPVVFYFEKAGEQYVE